MLLAKGLISVVLWCVVKSELVLQPNETVMCSKYSCLAASPICGCDPLCSVYGNCCLDAKNVSVRAKRPVKCSSVSNKWVYMISVCDDRYPTDVETRQKCDNATDAYRHDIPLHENPEQYDSVPVTSVDTQITYRNVHCARCNGDTNVVPWNVNITLMPSSEYNKDYFPDAYNNITETFLANNVVYFEEERSCGVHLWINGSYEFFPLFITVTAPAKVTLRVCDPWRIESCPPNWKDSRIASLCELFRDSVSNCFIDYKNKFCALCHDEIREELKCGEGYNAIEEQSLNRFITAISLNTASAMSKCESEGKHLDVLKKCKCAFENDQTDVEIVSEPDDINMQK